ncbi:MAG: cupin domain-containing protein [Legionella sp.]|nr:cupin domain-containing protein [Legionella sp.]
MLHFSQCSLETFLNHYWQKKPLFMPQALSNFKNPISADELAGLALEEELESRLVIQRPGQQPQWTLQRGPFVEGDFATLPTTHWTLLVQGVDRFVPEVARLFDNFDFIPQWRVDDVMISYAVEQGSVGPHYDNYDVFLYQAQGRRQWTLTTKDCVENNYITGLDLRIMKDFKTEMTFVLEEGDMLYLPPQVGHHGISLSKECMTYSFGYRSYQGQELWDSFGEHLSTKKTTAFFYQDPPWAGLEKNAHLPKQSWVQARKVLQAIINDDNLMQDWFGGFATQLDQQAENLLPPEDTQAEFSEFIQSLLDSKGLVRNTLCRFAYFKTDDDFTLYINGCSWDIEAVDVELVEIIANYREILLKDIKPFIGNLANESFLFALWQLQWLECITEES